MSRYLIYIYLVIVIVLTLLIFSEVRYGDPLDPEMQVEPTGFKTIAEKTRLAKEAFREIEGRMARIQIDPEYESMVLVSEGEFIMGTSNGHWTEQPERTIYLDNFRIGKYEVTFAQYYAFFQETGHRKPRLASYLGVETEDLPKLMNPFSPVVGVSWGDAAAYCLWKGKRLPTEAEWEKAAKGVEPKKWPWGDEEELYGNVKGASDGARYTAPVGAFRKDRSPYGVMDMAGNVMEWVSDWYREDSYAHMPAINPLGPGRGAETAHYREQRVIRGGSWNDSIHRAYTTTRFKMDPVYRDITIGFRCAKSA